MPNQRKEGKRLWGGYLEEKAFETLDREAARRGFDTRTEFLAWIASVAKELPKRKKG